MVQVVSIFERRETLPRGPHRLSRAEVAESQRTRLMAALTELLAERGYAAVRIGDLVARAGVSRASFYEHFADKEACLLSAYDLFAARVMTAITVPFGPDTTWPQFVDRMLAGYLEVLELDPTAARAFLVEMDAAGSRARQRRRDAMHWFAQVWAQRHAEIRKRDKSLGELPDVAYLALAFSVRDVVQDAMLDAGSPPLRELAPGLATMINAVVQGAAAAR
ncbi:MAG TPA: helix-turn-helix domain-containing protein [Solirubrobacteraceae bacterium]|jgi:AcrR family transcriptional regulator|nr:helix-turn-helix domain-containing protein [Solirubrobacteraceae bacterium]